MTRNIAETVLGGVVLIVAIIFLGWAYTRSSIGNSGGYNLTASFDQIGGLSVGSDVKISGIKVGSITGQQLNTDNYRAAVEFSVQDGVELPTDSSASIMSTSLLGGNFLALVPGADDVMLKDGDSIQFTQSAVNLEDLLGRFIFGQGGEGGSDASGGDD